MKEALTVIEGQKENFKEENVHMIQLIESTINKKLSYLRAMFYYKWTALLIKLGIEEVIEADYYVIE